MITRHVRVAAVLSMPRLAFTANMTCALQVFPALGIPCKTHTGVFWEQALSRLLEEALAAGCDYAISSDYDSVFTREDVVELIRLAETHGDAAAIHAVQMRREMDAPLTAVRGEDGQLLREIAAEKLAGEVTRTDYGHFGLTILRLAMLEQVPRPWLWGQPDQSGRWGDGRIDPDIYFWRKLQQQGLAFYQANAVRIGHCQQLITWPGGRYQPVHQYYDDYRQQGRPAGLEAIG